MMNKGMNTASSISLHKDVNMIKSLEHRALIQIASASKRTRRDAPGPKTEG